MKNPPFTIEEFKAMSAEEQSYIIVMLYKRLSDEEKAVVRQEFGLFELEPEACGQPQAA